MVVAHILLGEMVPKNIAIAGPERTAILLVPPFLVFTTVMRPVIELFNLMANGVLRLCGVEPRDELEAAFTSGELADLIAESGREGLLDDDESRRLARTLQLHRTSTVADVLVRRGRAGDAARPARPSGTWRARSRETGYSRFPVLAADGRVRRVPARQGHPGPDRRPGRPRCPPERVRGLPTVAADARLDVALAVLRRARAHLARAVDAAGNTVGLVTMEDLIEHYVGTVRDATNTRRRPA